MAITDKQSVIQAFAVNYNYLCEYEIDNILNRAVATYLDLLSPYNRGLVAIPTHDVRAWLWVYDCMVEIIERSGCSSVTAYSENGLSIRWDSSHLSLNLRSRVIPRVGVPN